MTGIIGGVSIKKLKEISIPVAPIDEQKHIVIKIEELLPYIDRYEQAWSKLEDFNKRFPVDMQKSILQLAIQGKLVEQRSEEGTGEELFQQIQTKKQALIKAGVIKKEKPLPEITDEEKPYDIPANWTWVRFGDLGSYKKGPFGSAITKSMFVPKGNGAVKVYEQKNAIQKDATLGDYYIRREYFESKMTGFEVFPGDIIVSCAGTIGETYVMPEQIEQGIINQALMRMKIFEPLYIPYFLTFFDFVLKKDARSSSKGSAIKNIPPFEILKNYLVPIPPLAEQKRIVAKLEEILPLCERLK
jgi:type I restriction enzyme S subunit